jgi:DNA polymerase-3 subunit alpha
LFLKAHYPLEFMVGVINNFGGFYQTEFYFHEAEMNGAQISAPCVNQSEYLTTIYGNEIFIGFVHLKSLESKLGQQIVGERSKNGPYQSLNNFLSRVALGLEQIRILIRIGAFRFTGKDKQRLLWEAMLYFSEVKVRIPTTINLFDTEPHEYPLPAFQRNEIEDAFDEIELLGFPLHNPFRLLTTSDYGVTTASALMTKLRKTVSIVGYLITTKNTRTRKGEPMYFGTFYDHEGIVFDTVHFPDVATKFPFRGRGFYEIKGKVIEDFGVVTIEVMAMNKLSLINKRQLPAERFEESRKPL